MQFIYQYQKGFHFLFTCFSFSRASSQPRNRTQVSHIAGRFFTNWGTRRAQVQNPVLSFTIEWTGENYLHTAGLKKKILIVFLSKSCYESLNRTHSSTLAWKTPWTEEPGRLQSMGSLRVGHDWVTSLSLFTFMHWRKKWQSEVTQSCPTLSDLVDCSLPGSSIHGIFQARVLE